MPETELLGAAGRSDTLSGRVVAGGQGYAQLFLEAADPVRRLVWADAKTLHFSLVPWHPTGLPRHGTLHVTGSEPNGTISDGGSYGGVERCYGAYGVV